MSFESHRMAQQVPVQLVRPDQISTPSLRRNFELDVLLGLSDKPKHLPSRYLYDDRGSELFSSICELPSYYPTACETEIFERHGQAIVDAVAPTRALQLIDLGAGDGRKTDLLLERFAATPQLSFSAIDISTGALSGLLERTRRRFPQVVCRGVVGEYLDGLVWLGSQDERQKLVLFLGSNVGNFTRDQARSFLCRIWEALNHGDFLLVGFDLKKSPQVLVPAYDDPQGVTRAFNLNLLARINAELGADFDLQAFEHFGTYDAKLGAMVSHVLSRRTQTVHIDALDRAFVFEAWEPIHLEYSYKYSDADIAALAESAHFEQVAAFYDERHWFSDRLWRVVKHLPAR